MCVLRGIVYAISRKRQLEKKEELLIMNNAKVTSGKGFTIVELLVTVVVIGIVSGLAAPQFDEAINRIKFRSQAKNMVSMLRTARSHTIAEKRPFGVHFDLNSGVISLFKDIHDPAAQLFDPVNDSVAAVDSLPPEFVYVYATFPTSAVIFQPNGSASESGDIYTIADYSDSYHFSQVSVLASTGKSKVEYICNY
jgi:prepilin-type N-terminal cleavage/methylation domain-containing protein